MKPHTLITAPLTRLLLSLCAVTLVSGWSLALDAPRELPTVLVLATGGTIAGVQNDPNDPARYKAGSLTAEEILASVPGLGEHARMEVEQFSNVPSTEITPADWVRLSNLITARLTERDDLAGVIVTHGTDRMEETAFFLHLTVDSQKPVIMVGAQRPATHKSADGPANLLSAVRTAVSPKARDRGVMIVMDERILSARVVRKDYPRVGGFGEGQIGIVGHDGPEFLYRPTRPHTHRSGLKVPADTQLPNVDLVFSYSGGSGPSYETLPAGIVITATNTTCAETLTFQEIARQDVPVVTAFPTGESARRLRPNQDAAPEWLRESCSHLADDPRWEGPWIWPLPARMLTPQKARILLMLALSTDPDRETLEMIFREY